MRERERSSKIKKREERNKDGKIYKKRRGRQKERKQKVKRRRKNMLRYTRKKDGERERK